MNNPNTIIIYNNKMPLKTKLVYFSFSTLKLLNKNNLFIFKLGQFFNNLQSAKIIILLFTAVKKYCIFQLVLIFINKLEIFIFAITNFRNK